MAEKIYYDSYKLSSLNNTTSSTTNDDDPDAAVPSNVKKDYLFKSINTKEVLIGTMPINTAQAKELSPLSIASQRSYTIPKGYHDGTGRVYTQELKAYTEATATSSDIINPKTAWVNGVKVIGTVDPALIKQEGTATAADILTGETAWVNGNKITGEMPENPDVYTQLNAGQSYTIPQGYHSGKSTVSAVGIGPQTPGTATADDILSPKTAWVDGAQLTGNIPSITPENTTLNAGESYNIDKAYYTKVATIIAKDLASQTQGDAIAADVIKDKIVWVNGIKITGILDDSLVEQDATATANDIAEGETAWVKKVKITGNVPRQPDVSRTLSAGQSYVIPNGIHSHNSIISAQDLASQTQGTALSTHIIKDKIAWVNGVQVTGSINEIAASTVELSAGQSYTIPQGYHDGNGIVKSNTIGPQTPGTATADDILSPKTAWVDGAQLTGVIATSTIKTIRVAAGNEIHLESAYFPDGLIIYSIYMDRIDLTGTDAEVIEKVLYPNSAGHVEDNLLVITAQLSFE